MTTPSKASQRMVPADQQCPIVLHSPPLYDTQCTREPGHSGEHSDGAVAWRTSAEQAQRERDYHDARPAAPTDPATPPVGAGTSEGATGPQIGVHESGLGDAIRRLFIVPISYEGSLVADRADALEAQITSLRDLAAELTFKGKGEPDDMPDEFELARDEVAYMIRKRLGDAQ